MAVPDAIREVGERLVRLMLDEAARCDLAPEVRLRRPDADFFTGTSPGMALHLYSVEPSPNPDSSDEREDTVIDGEPWSVFRPAPLPTKLRWAIAARAEEIGKANALLEVAIRALHAPERATAPASHPSPTGLPPVGGPPRPSDGHELQLDDTFDLERQALLLRSLGAPHHPLIGCVARVRLRSGRELRKVRRVDVRTVAVRRSTERMTERPEEGTQR